MAELAPQGMTYAEYLAAERRSDVKHEYLRGEAYAMAGGTPTHAGLAMAVGVALSNALAGRPCRVYGSDLRVRIDATDLSTYPDITVICGRFESASIDPDAATNPILIVEVLSDSTEAYDRGEKWAHYRRIESLQAYVLVSPLAQRLEAFVRSDAGFVNVVASADEPLELRCLGARLVPREIFANTL